MQHLDPIIDQFIAAASGEPDIEFWKRIVDRWGGSGRDNITGWLPTLFPYLKNNKLNPYLDWEAATPYRSNDVGDFQQAVSSAPFTWHYYAEKYEMQFLGGLFTPAINIDEQKVRVATGWAIKS